MNCSCGKIVENPDTGLCGSCARAERKALEAASKPPKEKKPIKKVGDKMEVAMMEYRKLKKEFIKANPMCAVFPNKPAVDIHHMAGRNTLELLLDTDKWLAVSREAHIWIENNPIEAKAKGYSLSRLAVEPHKI